MCGGGELGILPVLMAKSPREALEGVLTSVTGEPLVILLSGHPDPDAIGSALAHKRLCEHVGVPAQIAHVLGLSHRQNRALVKLLGVEMLQVRSAAELARFRHLSLVDTLTPEPLLQLPPELHVLTVVDHHRGPSVEARFADIRTGIAATSSIYAEYLSQGFAPLGRGTRDDARVATALFFGIQTDSDDFSLATPEDFAAAAYVRSSCDVDILQRIGRRTVGAAAMSVVGRALTDLVVVRDFAVAGVGFVAPADRDTVGSAADYILRREDIDTALTYAVVGDRIDGSLRTNNASLDPASFLEAVFGADAQGRSYGGGRADKGGFQIPLGMLAECEDRKALWALVQQVVKSRLAKEIPELESQYERQARRGQAIEEPHSSAGNG